MADNNKVQQPPRLRVTAIVKDNNRILMIEESIKSENNQLFWLFPGGGVERGEKLEDTLRREVREETKIQVKNIVPYTFFERVFPENNLHTLNFYYVVERASGDVVLESSANSFGWFTKEEALNLKLMDGNREIIEKLVI